MNTSSARAVSDAEARHRIRESLDESLIVEARDQGRDPRRRSLRKRFLVALFDSRRAEIEQMGASILEVKRDWTTLWILTIVYGLLAVLATRFASRNEARP